MNKTTFVCQSSDALYFESIKYAHNNGIKKVLLFIQKKDKILELASYIQSNKFNIDIIGVTFPSNEKMYIEKENEITEYIPPAANGYEIKNILSENGIKLISGTLPFEGIVVPGSSSNPYMVIKQTLGLISPGLQNSVQSVLMATDQGILNPLEKVVSMNNQISIEVEASNTRFLFHPLEGLKIKHFVAVIEKKEEAKS